MAFEKEIFQKETMKTQIVFIFLRLSIINTRSIWWKFKNYQINKFVQIMKLRINLNLEIQHLKQIETELDLASIEFSKSSHCYFLEGRKSHQKGDKKFELQNNFFGKKEITHEFLVRRMIQKYFESRFLLIFLWEKLILTLNFWKFKPTWD